MMHRISFRRIILAAAGAVSIATCGDAGDVPFTPDTPALGTGFWYLNAADDSTLGSTIATRSVGVALERTVVDSGWLNITSAGEFEQRYWLRVFVTDLLDRTETVIDVGTWNQTGPKYTFTSVVRARTFTVTTAVTGQLTTAEPMVFFTDAPSTEGLYRRTRP